MERGCEMVKDNTNQVYTELIQYLKGIYPQISGGTNYPEKLPSFPYLYFFQIDAPTALTTLSNTEEGIRSAYQIEIYTDTGMNKARKIANDVRLYMISNGFTCRTFMPVNAPSNVSRFVTRFNRLDV